MPVYLDMLDYPVDVVSEPKRIVSLVPSLSLLLHDLGVGDRLVGVTKFCVHPEELRNEKQVIGGTKLLHPDKIRELNPDLIIANKEENNQSDIEMFQEEFPVWISDIITMEDAINTINMLGSIVNCKNEAEEMIKAIRKEQRSFAKNPTQKKSKVIYVIWKEPLMIVGGDTFIDSMINEGGWTNAAAGYERYPQITFEELKEMSPDYLLLSSEPFPFKEKHKQVFSSILDPKRIFIVDGEMFSWYGSRLKSSFKYFKELHQSMQ